MCNVKTNMQAKAEVFTMKVGQVRTTRVYSEMNRKS